MFLLGSSADESVRAKPSKLPREKSSNDHDMGRDIRLGIATGCGWDGGWVSIPESPSIDWRSTPLKRRERTKMGRRSILTSQIVGRILVKGETVPVSLAMSVKKAKGGYGKGEQSRTGSGTASKKTWASQARRCPRTWGGSPSSTYCPKYFCFISILTCGCYRGGPHRSVPDYSLHWTVAMYNRAGGYIATRHIPATKVSPVAEKEKKDNADTPLKMLLLATMLRILGREDWEITMPTLRLVVLFNQV